MNVPVMLIREPYEQRIPEILLTEACRWMPVWSQFYTTGCDVPCVAHVASRLDSAAGIVTLICEDIKSMSRRCIIFNGTLGHKSKSFDTKKSLPRTPVLAIWTR